MLFMLRRFIITISIISCDYYDLVMVLFSKVIMVLLTILAFSQHYSSRHISHNNKGRRSKNSHPSRKSGSASSGVQMDPQNSRSSTIITDPVKSSGDNPRLEIKNLRENHINQVLENGWDVKKHVKRHSQQQKQQKQQENLELTMDLEDEDDQEDTAVEDIAIAHNIADDHRNLRHNLQENQKRQQSQQKSQQQTRRSSWAGYEHLCETTTRTVHLNTDNREEFNPPFYIEVRCKNQKTTNSDGSSGSQGTNSIQKCAFNLLHCVQTYSTTYFSRRTAGDVSWRPHSLVVPSGCECMWPVEEFGPLKRSDEL